MVIRFVLRGADRQFDPLDLLDHVLQSGQDVAVVVAGERRRAEPDLDEIRGAGQRQADPVAPFGLGEVERLVRPVDELGLGPRVGRAGGHPDADRHLQALAGAPAPERMSPDGFAHALRHPERLVGIGVGQHDGELLAPVPGRDIVGPDRLLDDLRDLPQRRITLGMAVLVVEALEVIDVDHQDGDLVPEPLGLQQLARQVLLEVPMVEEPGQPVQVDEAGYVVRLLLGRACSRPAGQRASRRNPAP